MRIETSALSNLRLSSVRSKSIYKLFNFFSPTIHAVNNKEFQLSHALICRPHTSSHRIHNLAIEFSCSFVVTNYINRCDFAWSPPLSPADNSLIYLYCAINCVILLSVDFCVFNYTPELIAYEWYNRKFRNWHVKITLFFVLLDTTLKLTHLMCVISMAVSFMLNSFQEFQWKKKTIINEEEKMKQRSNKKKR